MCSMCLWKSPVEFPGGKCGAISVYFPLPWCPSPLLSDRVPHLQAQWLAATPLGVWCPQHLASTSGHSWAPQSPTSLTNIRFLASTAYKISINADVCLNLNNGWDRMGWDGMGWIDGSCNPVAETQNFPRFLYSNRIHHFHSTKWGPCFFNSSCS